MEAAKEQKSVYLREFEAMPATGETWLDDLRRRAMADFERQGFPHRRIEAWKNANLASLAQQHFPPAAPGADIDGYLRKLTESVPDALRMVFVDGHFSARHSDLTDLPEGLRMVSLAEAFEAGDVTTDAHFGRHADTGEHPFAALSTAFARDGALIELAPGTIVERPVVLHYFTSEGGAGMASYPRLLVHAGTGSEVRLVEHHAGVADEPYLTCPVSEIVVDDNAGVRLQHLQESGNGAWHLGVVHVELGRDARFGMHAFSGGARFGRTDVYVNLNGSGAQASLNGLYMVSSGQFADYHTWVRHRTDHGSSEQYFKGVLDGKAESVFDGLIHVAKGAQQTDSQQQNRNLLLSPRATAHSNPRLEIYADDVKCGHGSTVGELDADALFYLRSRGLGEREARRLLIFAFANETLDSMTAPELRDHVEARLANWLDDDRAGGSG